MIMEWHTLNWQQIGEAVAAGNDCAILPIGATEQHGPHMGCGMDAEIAKKLCRAVAEETGAFLLPLLPYGCSIGHSTRWPGTLALQPKTLIDMIKDIGDWIYASGIRRLFIVNSHVGNFAPLRCALEMLRAQHDGFMVALIGSPTISERVKQQHFADGDDWHANDAETSLMLAVSPEMVDELRLQDSDDEDRTAECVFAHPVNRTSKNGVTGKPSLASKAKGETLFSWMVEDLSALVHKGQSETAPLDFSYHQSIDFIQES